MTAYVTGPANDENLNIFNDGEITRDMNIAVGFVYFISALALRILKWIFENLDGEAQPVSIWLSMGTGGGLL